MTNKILIIDDEDLLLESMKGLLEEKGYDVYCSENGKEGLEVFNNHHPQVIILDLNMPNMGGIEFLQKLHPKTTLAHSVIVLTGHSTNEDIEKCYQLGVQSFLRKPVSYLEIAGAIQRAFDIIRYSNDLKQEILAKEKSYQELEIQKNLLRNTFEGMAEGVIKLDSNFHIRIISSKACLMLGISEDDALGKPVAEIIGSIIAGPSGLLMRCVKNKKNANDVQTQLLCPSGAIIPVTLSILSIATRTKKMEWLLLFQNMLEKERVIRDRVKGSAFGCMIGCDQKMKVVFGLIEKIASKNTTILIEGENGTGKELVAREIHKRSDGAQKTFHAINCAAIPSTLLETEFFGYEKGAFTGAYQAKQGRFELANGGTLFLDEIGEIPIELQGKLLRALQEQSFERVGGTRTIRVDIRIIAATNRNLKKMIQKKLFRKDLYYRLNVISIKLPPLQERMQDIPLLVAAFIEEFNRKEHQTIESINPDTLQLLLNYSWPGNVRELYHVIEHAFAVSDGPVLQTQHLPDIFQEINSFYDSPSPKNEKELILQALQQTNFRKIKAAALLGMSRSTLYRKRKQYGI